MIVTDDNWYVSDMWLNGEQAGALIGLSASTIKHYRLDGKLPDSAWKKLNSRTVRYSTSELLRWMEDDSI